MVPIISSIESIRQFFFLIFLSTCNIFVHYFAKRFYQPILLSACEDGTNVNLHITNDTLEHVSGTIIWRLRDSLSGILMKGEKEIGINALKAEWCESIDFKDLESDPGKRRNVYFEFAFIRNNKIMCRDIVLFVKPKHFEFKEPGIEIIPGEITLEDLTKKLFTRSIYDIEEHAEEG